MILLLAFLGTFLMGCAPKKCDIDGNLWSSEEVADTINTYSARVNRLQSEVDALNQERDRLQDALDDKEAELQRLESQCDAMKSEI